MNNVIQMKPNKSRKTWPMPFSETNTTYSVNEWIRFFSSAWLAYLLFNTNNPIAQYLLVSRSEFENHFTGGICVRTIGGGLLYVAIILLGLYWAGGRHGFGALFPKFRARNIGFVFGYGLIYVVCMSLGSTLARLAPSVATVDVSNTLSGAQIVSWTAFATYSMQNLFMTFGNQIIIVMVFLMLYQVFSRYLAAHHRWLLGLTYFTAGIIAGLVMTTPSAPDVFQNIVLQVCLQVPLFWAYRRSRDVLVVALASWWMTRIMVAVVIAFSML